jgi:hypothetical protein
LLIGRLPSERSSSAAVAGSGETDGHRSRLHIELRGNLAAMLRVAQHPTRSPVSGDRKLQIARVAGACSQRYLQLWSGAA